MLRLLGLLDSAPVVTSGGGVIVVEDLGNLFGKSAWTLRFLLADFDFDMVVAGIRHLGMIKYRHYECIQNVSVESGRRWQKCGGVYHHRRNSVSVFMRSVLSFHFLFGSWSEFI